MAGFWTPSTVQHALATGSDARLGRLAGVCRPRGPCTRVCTMLWPVALLHGLDRSAGSRPSPSTGKLPVRARCGTRFLALAHITKFSRPCGEQATIRFGSGGIAPLTDGVSLACASRRARTAHSTGNSFLRVVQARVVRWCSRPRCNLGIRHARSPRVAAPRELFSGHTRF